MGPATPFGICSTAVVASCAQRRPARWGRQPRRPRLPTLATCRSLNEGRPGGAGNPRSCGCRVACSVSTLNEGRPGGAGNPSYQRCSIGCHLSAQRRPARWGRQPRRHHQLADAATHPRSTKAGPVGPATPHQASVVPMRRRMRAQRRPARWGRQPTQGWQSQACSCPTSLNEGRPGGAGNPVRFGEHLPHAHPRSTKAGPVGPATPATPKSGISSLARSTKAGPVGPATPVGIRVPVEASWNTLNEGRPGGAGNPRAAAPASTACLSALNEGRPGGGRQPTMGPNASSLLSSNAQRRPARWGRQP